MFNCFVAASCGQYKPALYAATVLLGILITVYANWRRKGGRFKAEYAYVGAELATASIVAGFTLCIEFSYIIWCTDGTFWRLAQWANQYPGRAIAPFIILLNMRIYRYCRNQEWRAIRSGLTFSRGIRNTFVGSLALTVSLVAFS
jgi:hypothetical protein